MPCEQNGSTATGTTDPPSFPVNNSVVQGASIQTDSSVTVVISFMHDTHANICIFLAPKVVEFDFYKKLIRRCFIMANETLFN